MNVLVATDLSAPAYLAVDLVRSTSWPDGTAIRLLSVVPPFGGPGTLAEIALPVDDRFMAAVRNDAGRLARALERGGLSVECDVRLGRAADEIVAEAAARAADLVVVGSRGRGPVATALLGSVAAEVADHAPCPVLVARRPAINKVVFAEDGSDGAAEAFAFLSQPSMRRALRGVPVEVVGIHDPTLPWTVAAEGDPYLTESAVEAYASALRARRAELERAVAARGLAFDRAGASTKTSVRDGYPASGLVAAAEEADGDLIVVGSRGRTGLARVMLGSVARGVLTHAGCSVLIVRRRG